MDEFCLLVAFDQGAHELERPFGHLRPHLAYFWSEALAILQGPRPHVTSSSPYIGRALLEAALSCILFRVDPFRASTLLRFQSHKDFDLNRPNSISIDWTGDIISDVVSKDIWNPKQKPDAVSRALLSPYQQDVLWAPALSAARDYIASGGIVAPQGILLYEEDAVERIRGELRQLYSFWSKGIHCEFFAMGPAFLDEITCLDKLRRTIHVVSDLGFVSHFAPNAATRQQAEVAMSAYQTIKDALNG